MSLSTLHCLSFSLLLLPPLLISTYLLASFPTNPQSTQNHPSLASLPKSSKTWTVYPEDFYPNGQYLDLPQGRMRYWLLGPETGRKVVLIHGLSIPALVWKDVAPKLVAKGYRVLLYDLFGRGYSDAPRATYDAALYSTQLALLMQHLEWSRASVIGVSMGGGIAAAFTSYFPHLVEEQMVLVACAGLMTAADLPRTAKFITSPLVQSLTSSFIIRTYLQRLANSSAPIPVADKPDPDPLAEIVRLQSAHLPGYNFALSSSLRDGPIRGQAPSFAALGRARRRVLLIHGTKDRTVPFEHAGRILNLVSGVPRSVDGQIGGKDEARSKVISVEGGGHDLTVSHGDQVAGWIDEWLKR